MINILTKSALAAVICLALFSDSCDDEPELTVPNPGFGIISKGQLLNGLHVTLPGAVTRGRIPRTPITNQLIYPNGATGTRAEFEVQGNSAGKAVVPDGIAPAHWALTGGPGWQWWEPMGHMLPPLHRSCEGRPGFMTMQRGQWNTIGCTMLFGIQGGLPPGSSSINVSEPGIEIEVAGGGVNSTYGMPTFQFYDAYGTYVAQTTATSIDTENGLWAKGRTDSLAGLPTGTYNIVLLNETADGAGEQAGGAYAYLYGASSANYIDDHRFFVAQQYRDLLGREPDQAGLDAWTSVITQCSNPSYRQANETYGLCVVRQRVNVAHGFWYSAEFANRYPAVVGAGGFNNAEFSRLCHALYLLREPAQADQDFWTSQLDGTGDYDFVLKAFIYSDEYRARFEPQPGPVCEPPWEDVNNCQQQGWSWDYNSCSCSWGNMILY